MASSKRESEEIIPTQGIGDLLARAGVDWLAPLRGRLSTMKSQDRLPHALLLLGQPGAGQLELGVWLAALLLCDRKGDSACGECAGCKLVQAGTHPDFYRVGLEDDAAVIKVEQIRGLSESFALKSYRGHSKVALVDPADAMNLNSFNALLKTLEEPSDNTYLILVASRSDRLPRTIVSRSARMRLPLPRSAEALVWLNGRRQYAGWERLLALANGAPFLALQYAQAGLEEIDSKMQETLDSAEKGQLDILATAAAWSRDQPEARLFWLESWITGRLREAALASDLDNDNRLPWLRVPAREPLIRAGYRLLDALREARMLVNGSLNTQLLFEGLLISLSGLVGAGTGKLRESVD
jgi:DNA polymerase III subunit delta'